MHLFYTPQISDSKVLLNEEESKHCINVLRLRVNDEIFLVDGVGGFYKAQIVTDHSKKCEVQITESNKEWQKRNFNLHIAIAPTKNIERTEWFLEKATEIGIDAVTPINCEHSERTVVKPERLQKVLISAMKQSLKAYLPALHENISFKKCIEGSKDFQGQKFIAHCFDLPKEPLQKIYTKGKDALILIGPEGDFSKEEIELAIAFNFLPVSLSSSRLRTETAALVACQTLNLINEI